MLSRPPQRDTPRPLWECSLNPRVPLIETGHFKYHNIPTRHHLRTRETQNTDIAIHAGPHTTLLHTKDR